MKGRFPTRWLVRAVARGGLEAAAADADVGVEGDLADPSGDECDGAIAGGGDFGDFAGTGGSVREGLGGVAGGRMSMERSEGKGWGGGSGAVGILAAGGGVRG